MSDDQELVTSQDSPSVAEDLELPEGDVHLKPAPSPPEEPLPVPL